MKFFSVSGTQFEVIKLNMANRKSIYVDNLIEDEFRCPMKYIT